MQVLERIVEQHSDDDVLINVASIIEFLNSDIAIAQLLEGSRLRLLDGIMFQFQQNMQRFIQEEDRLDEEDEAALISCYRKITAFSS